MSDAALILVVELVDIDASIAGPLWPRASEARSGTNQIVLLG
jgi:hypothetical protein